jgi:uncharacterized protein (TIGR00369 family)
MMGEAMHKQPSSRFCFLCGKENDSGLKMEWKSDTENQRVIARVRVPDHFNGYPGVVHGGIVAAILDETAGRATLLEDDDNLMVTLKLEITYRQPTPTEEELTVVGWPTRITSRRALVEGELFNQKGEITATCKAVVVRPPEKIKAGWEQEKQYWKVYNDKEMP